jgi:hypothetical protein
MTEEEKIQLLSKLVNGGNGGNTKIGQIILDNHGTMNINNGEAKPMGDNLASTDIDSSMVSQALAKCGDYIWGNSAYAVPFCVCRDVYGWEDNASLFERKLELEGVELPPGTINTAINRNPYMKLPIFKWKDNGAKERVLKFKEEFERLMEDFSETKS